MVRSVGRTFGPGVLGGAKAPPYMKWANGSDDSLLLFHSGGLALEVAQERELGAPHLGPAQHVDLVDGRRVQREDALHALAEGHFPDGEGRAAAAPVQRD